MSERAAAFADRFERANAEFVALVGSLPEEEWRLVCPDEGRTIAALAHHVADAYPFEIEAFRTIAEGRGGDGYLWDRIHQANARGAKANARSDQAETIALLNANAAAAAAIVRTFSDQQLDEEGTYIQGEPRLTVATWIVSLLIGHIEGHLSSIVGALAQYRAVSARSGGRR